MKNLILALLLTTSVVAFGQNEKRKMNGNQEFTSEQQAILKTKKMVLALDLNKDQQGQILQLNKTWIQEKTATKAAHKSLNREEMTSDQKFDLMNQGLDTKLAHQEQIKKILNKDQYKLWKESSRKMHYRSKGKNTQAHKTGRKG